MNLNEVQAKGRELARLAAEADALQKRYTAHLMLYDAACMAGQPAEMAQRREDCHTLLDLILDNVRDVQVHTAELQRMMG